MWKLDNTEYQRAVFLFLESVDYGKSQLKLLCDIRESINQSILEEYFIEHNDFSGDAQSLRDSLETSIQETKEFIRTQTSVLRALEYHYENNLKRQTGELTEEEYRKAIEKSPIAELYIINNY